MDMISTLIVVGTIWINPYAVNALTPTSAVFLDTSYCTIHVASYGYNPVVELPCIEVAHIIENYFKKVNQE